MCAGREWDSEILTQVNANCTEPRKRIKTRKSAPTSSYGALIAVNDEKMFDMGGPYPVSPILTIPTRLLA